MRRRPTPKRECGKILTLLYEAWLCFLTLLVEGLPLKFNTGRCVCKFDTVTPEPKLVKIGHVTRKCITICSLYVNVSLRQVTKCLNAVNGTYIPEPWGSGAFSFVCRIVTLFRKLFKPFFSLKNQNLRSMKQRKVNSVIQSSPSEQIYWFIYQ